MAKGLHQEWPLRLGLVALAVSGVLTALTIIVRGPFVDPGFNPELFARGAAAPQFLAYSFGTMLAVLTGVYGYIALYAYLTYTNRSVASLALWGMVLNIGLVLLMPSLGVYAFAGPAITDLYARDPRSAVELTSQMAGGAYLAPVLVQGLLYSIGSLLFGIAIWRSATLPRWSGVLFFVQAPLIEFILLVSYPAEIVGGLMLAISSVWIGYRSIYNLGK